ncbi:MAG: hypothetical protein WBF89_14785 [Steroidobacteraceae bacterium]
MSMAVRRPRVRGDAVADEVPIDLYQHARRRLLVNEPMLGYAAGRPAAAQALTAGEIDALKSVGLSTAAWAGAKKEDPLMQSIADYMALIETSFTTAQAAAYLRLDVSRIRQRLRERSLFGLEYDGERRLPRFQFERKQVLPGLREVIGALPQNLHPLDAAEWFLLPNPDLEDANQSVPLSPREWLLRGNPISAVVALAQGFE